VRGLVVERSYGCAYLYAVHYAAGTAVPSTAAAYTGQH
jgi:hypothetical protein